MPSVSMLKKKIKKLRDASSVNQFETKFFYPVSEYEIERQIIVTKYTFCFVFNLNFDSSIYLFLTGCNLVPLGDSGGPAEYSFPGF